jgi:predicted  nucleic acid-binding Zn-ribbon protein
MTCPDCGSVTAPYSDAEWLYRCPKCGRGKLREIVETIPMPEGRKPTGKGRKEYYRDPRTMTCYVCGKTFQTICYAKKQMMCPECRLDDYTRRKREYERNRRRKRARERRGVGVEI